ncbi:MAG: FtsX-like permease family protein [Myxococcota bacterium]|nr:FtsX-like permease family protein [Myxococcota bacterium]
MPIEGALLGTVRGLLRPSTWRIALRNVARNTRRTAIVLTAITVGLSSMLLAMAINYGMIFQMIQTAIRTDLGHVQVHARGWSDQPGIEWTLSQTRTEAGLTPAPGKVLAAAPRVRGEGLVFSPRASVGVRVLGVDPVREAELSAVAASVTEGQYLGSEQRRVVVGERLAERLKVGVGDKVVVSVQDVLGDMTGEAFRIGGTFRTASRDIDEGVVFLRIGEGQALFGLEDAVTEWVLLAEADGDEEALREEVGARLGDEVEVSTWKELRPFLVQMMDMFKQTGWVLYAAIFIAMAFGIANVLLMAVMERIREIGILMAIGMAPGRVVASIVAESIVLTGLGVAGGVALGLFSIEALSGGIDLSRWSEGLVTWGIPPKIVPALPEGELWVPVGIATITALLASLWPAVRAVRIRPAEAVRHI